jgi:hypothetical protein
VSYFEALPEIDRGLGVCPVKLVFPPGYTTPLTYTVEIDCVRVDGQIETRTVLVEAGASGPRGEDEFGDVIPVVPPPKLGAEAVGEPWREVGLYRGVADVRLVEPASAPGCTFAIVNDSPWLAAPDGVPVEQQAATPLAVQIAGESGSPHLVDDAVGQVFLFYTRDGEVYMRKRAGLPGEWDLERQLTQGRDASEPWAGKNERGELVMVVSRDGGRLAVMRSLDDGRNWEEMR